MLASRDVKTQSALVASFLASGKRPAQISALRSAIQATQTVMCAQWSVRRCHVERACIVVGADGQSDCVFAWAHVARLRSAPRAVASCDHLLAISARL